MTASFVALGPASAQAAGIGIKYFPTPTPQSNPYGIAAGPNGQVWFAEGFRIGEMESTGTSQDFVIGTGHEAQAITPGPNGEMWFTDPDADMIGEISMSGQIAEYPLPADSGPDGGITAGPDGNIWITDFGLNSIDRMTLSGTVTVFPIPTAQSFPEDITAGPDGNLWFTEDGTGKIGRITPSGTITEFYTGSSKNEPFGITAGPDGNLWFTMAGNHRVGVITPQGAITQYQDLCGTCAPLEIATGPDGNLWFTERRSNRVGRITPAGMITQFGRANSASDLSGITAGPDGDVWFAALGTSQIGRVNLHSAGSLVLGTAAGFAPAHRQVPLGDSVTFMLAEPGPVRLTNDLGVVGATTTGPVSFYSAILSAAGSYRYRDQSAPGHGGYIDVPVVADPTQGTAQGSFTIVWASAPLPAGDVADVSVAYCPTGSCSPQYQAWRTSATDLSGTFSASDPAWQGAGWYWFRSDLLNTTTGAHSELSPPARLVVSS